MSSKDKKKKDKESKESKEKKVNSSPKSKSKSKTKTTIKPKVSPKKYDPRNDDEDDDEDEPISGWGFTKADELKYRKQYTESVKNLKHTEEVNTDLIEQEESTLWVDVYAPKTIKEYIDDNHNIDQALRWLNNFRTRVKKTPPILLLTGKPGSGKTTLAHILFKELNYEYKEFNASEARSGKEIKEYLEPFNQGNIVEFFEGCEEVRKGLIMDEIDGIDSRSTVNDGLSVFLAMTEVSVPDRFKYPVICIANDSVSSKIEKIRRYSFELEIKQPSKKTLIKFMERIAKGEKLDIESQVLKDIVENSEQDFRQVANKLYYLATSIKANKKGIRSITVDDFKEIKELTLSDKKLELNQIIQKIFDPTTSIKEALRLYETDITIITMSFYSNFTENITKLTTVPKKNKIATLAKISDYLVDGEIYSDFYWHNKYADINDFQGVNQIVIPKYLLNNLMTTKTPKWDFTGKRIFYLNPHIMDKFFKISISLNIYSNSHLLYLVELIWNLIKSKKMMEQEKVYRKILYSLFEGGLDAKDFENIYKGFTLGQNETKDNDEIYKELKVVIKKYFNEFSGIRANEFQASLESMKGQLDYFLT